MFDNKDDDKISFFSEKNNIFMLVLLNFYLMEFVLKEMKLINFDLIFLFRLDLNLMKLLYDWNRKIFQEFLIKFEFLFDLKRFVFNWFVIIE